MKGVIVFLQHQCIKLHCYAIAMYCTINCINTKNLHLVLDKCYLDVFLALLITKKYEPHRREILKLRLRSSVWKQFDPCETGDVLDKLPVVGRICKGQIKGTNNRTSFSTHLARIGIADIKHPGNISIFLK